MQRKGNPPSSKGNSGLGVVVAGLVGMAIGFFATKVFSEEEEKKTPEDNQRIPVPINNNDSQSTSISNQTNSSDCDDIICPITQEVMKDPFVSRVCGHSFEREAIYNWIEKKQTCPKCNASLKKEDLVRNYTLKSVIEHFTKNQN